MDVVRQTLLDNIVAPPSGNGAASMARDFPSIITKSPGDPRSQKRKRDLRGESTCGKKKWPNRPSLVSYVVFGGGFKHAVGGKELQKGVSMDTIGCGTSIALAIPLVFLARQRKNVIRKALNESSTAPPRRRGPASTGIAARKPISTASGTAETTSSSSSTEFKSPGTGELLSAISRVDFSTAIFAGKAFAIATGIVTVGGVALAVGVKSMMGVSDTREFADRMRMIVWRGLPSLTSKIHRPPEVGDEGVPVPVSMEPDPTWTWEEAEKRLQAAYDKGGFPAWVQTAMKEMEDELKVERARRQREYDLAERRESVS
ncbi:hypothetical protein D9615_006262 [Tricholomella constricta]|uniref:Uncharacterized protein n=1 Tax=Tricholomella constricta TaxID=117010 RepID=A0A8H5HAQ9_9AGAR|nr:hypothetical protein D9615_006262 [Tricholomella constricta]